MNPLFKAGPTRVPFSGLQCHYPGRRLGTRFVVVHRRREFSFAGAAQTGAESALPLLASSPSFISTMPHRDARWHARQPKHAP